MSPETVQLVVDVVQPAALATTSCRVGWRDTTELAVTVYEVTGDPPSSTGAVHYTTAPPLPAVALTLVGAPGAAGATGVTADDAPEVTEWPPG